MMSLALRPLLLLLLPSASSQGSTSCEGKPAEELSMLQNGASLMRHGGEMLDAELEETPLQIDGRLLDLMEEAVSAAQKIGSGSHAIEQGRCDGGWRSGPVIIGGLSDSGTRGAKYIVNTLMNITMQAVDVHQTSGDDNLMNTAIGRFWKSFIQKVHGRISEDTYSSVASFHSVADELCEAVKTNWRLAGSPSGAWGFKSPRSILMTPIWNYLFGENYRFVHVVRDPRLNCASKSNKKQYEEVCGYIMSSEECAYPQGCFNYWARVNGDVHEMFESKGLRAQYVFLSMDRLSLPDPVVGSASFDMAKYELAKLSHNGIEDDLALKICTEAHQHAESYMPSSIRDEQAMRTQLNLATKHSQLASRLGYKRAEWSLESTYHRI